MLHFPMCYQWSSLPTEPPIELMDAGLRDNYGLKTSLEFIRLLKIGLQKIPVEL